MLKPALAIALFAAAPALAQVPDKGEGDVTLLGGARLIVPSSSDYLSASGASHQLATFAGLASFGYQFDEELHFKIEGGYLPDKYTRTAAGDLSIRSVPIFFAVDTLLFKAKDLSLYAGGGLGYMLTTGTVSGVNNEANSTAAYLAIGFRYNLAGIFALVVEDRYILASSAADPNHGGQTINEGGNLFLAGFMFHFFQKPDHPDHP
jgi:hypothetical protein